MLSTCFKQTPSSCRRVFDEVYRKKKKHIDVESLTAAVGKLAPPQPSCQVCLMTFLFIQLKASLLQTCHDSWCLVMEQGTYYSLVILMLGMHLFISWWRWKGFLQLQGSWRHLNLYAVLNLCFLMAGDSSKNYQQICSLSVETCLVFARTFATAVCSLCDGILHNFVVVFLEKE